MVKTKTFKMIVNNNLHTSNQTFLWEIGKKCNINSNIFIPSMAVKCINYKDQNNDDYDLIKVNNIYPVILVSVNCNENMYLIINDYGRKQYWSSSDFEIICGSEPFK